MKRNTLALFFSSAILASAGAFAAGGEPGPYLGAGYTDASIDFDVIDKDADIGVLFARAGYQINQNIAVEGRLGTGVDDDEIYGVEVELKDTYGVYVKAGFPTQSGLYPYALLGMTHVKVKASGFGGSETDSDSDISYGIGADYWFNSTVSAGLELANLYDKDGDEVTGITFGMNFRF